MSCELNIPDEFVKRLVRDLGGEIAAKVTDAILSGIPATPSVRLNLRKGALPGDALCPAPVALSGGEGHYLACERPVFAFDPMWHSGIYYVQDAASMAVSAVYNHLRTEFFPEKTALTTLDACAAPGGKTIAMIDALPDGSFVVANEYDRRRVAILDENLQKWGYPNVAVTSTDTAAFRKLRDVFDIVAVDAPCSGEGMMRKEPEAVKQWSAGLVEDCARLQREIVANVNEALCPGGFLIYSTCTLNRRENEENVRFFVENMGLELVEVPALEHADGVLSLEPSTYRFMPGFFNGEGLFIAVMRKSGTSSVHKEKKVTAGPSKSKISVSNVLPGSFVPSVIPGSQQFFGVEAEYVPFVETLKKVLPLRSVGVPLGELKGSTNTPSHGLSLSTVLKNDAFPRYELKDYNEAVAYLRGESFGALDSVSSKGFVIAAWKGCAVGFLKNIGNRANNLFPQALRLKTVPPSGYLPPSIAT